MKRRRQVQLKPTASSGQSAPSELPTFLDHVHELRRRLFWVMAVVLIASSAAYPFLNNIIGILTAPLGPQQLYYLTPIGGLSFSIKICIYAGVLVAVPFLMYHLYRYLEPLMGAALRKSAFFYVGLSLSFATLGVLFAYFISLPGALHFLTGLNIDHIQAMLTVDSYLSFVMTYLLGAALLFQIPLLLLIINTMTPLKPSKLMKIQRFVILGAFIIAAIISPTPDILNQTLFALPIIAMYQIGVVLVWFQNRSRAKRKVQTSVVVTARATMPVESKPLPQAVPLGNSIAPTRLSATQPAAKPPYIDIMAPRRTKIRTAGMQVRPPAGRAQSVTVPRRSIDGFTPYRPPQPVRSS